MPERVPNENLSTDEICDALLDFAERSRRSCRRVGDGVKHHAERSFLRKSLTGVKVIRLDASARRPIVCDGDCRLNKDMVDLLPAVIHNCDFTNSIRPQIRENNTVKIRM